MSIAEGIVQVLEDQARVQNYSRVEKVWLEIGPMAGIELDSLRFCFGAVTRGTLAENAALEIIETKGEAWCMHCAKTVAVRQRFDACPDCGSYQLQVTSGDEMRIKELEVN
ncbi:MAG: hydrogenase maturation nickel metallochaperone HypA [Hyphomicrobiales bacterium]|nr:MAG: hydrogenase maturation nickel metallochaperone HypA [Hyphomicrobiales bacterium]